MDGLTHTKQLLNLLYIVYVAAATANQLSGVALDQATVLPNKVSHCKLAYMMDGHQSSEFSLLISIYLDVCLVEWYQGKSV